ncbi:hypothetical protein ACUTRI_09605 [Serratia sp. TSA_130.2]|uniref:hypothetical protein n=1 Tax=unclassified Serratia (in: enterobacteria) TaxID=2647522 RepID=UPI004045342C
MTLTTERQQFEQWWETAMHNGYPPRFGWEHWRDGDGYRDDDGEFQGLWLAWLASRKLANREAQPVLYASEETLAYAKEGEKSLVTWSEPMGDAVIPLFTIPKAQTSGVVNLPTEFISDEGVLVRLEQVMAALALVGVKYERRGDACRAAMLNHVGDANEKAAEKCECSSIDYCENCLRAMLTQPVSQGYTLPEGGNDHNTRR